MRTHFFRLLTLLISFSFIVIVNAQVKFRDSIIHKTVVTTFCNSNAVSDQTKKLIISSYDNYYKRIAELDKTPRSVSPRGNQVVTDAEVQLRMQAYYKLDNIIKKALGKELYKKYLDYCFEYRIKEREATGKHQKISTEK